MFKITRRSRLVKVAAATAAVGSLAAIGFAGNSPASADPAQFTALTGVGSDTTQDVMNALAGGFGNNGASFTAVRSSSGQQLASFDATGSACIILKPNGKAIDRPNGSSAGRTALSRAIDAGNWPASSSSCSGSQATGTPGSDPSGLINFARSSSGPRTLTPATLTYVPFGRDAVSFGYYRAAGSPVTSLTRAQLTDIYKTAGGLVVPVAGGPSVRIIACGIQTSSGTYSFTNSAFGTNATDEAIGTKECNDLIDADLVLAGIQQTRAQENSPGDLKARGDLATTGTQVIIGYSAGNFIAQSNLTAPGPTPSSQSVGIGSISDNGAGTDLGNPVAATTPLTPSSTFYGDGTFGRRIFNVFPTTVFTGAGNTSTKTMFTNLIAGSPSTLCAASATIQAFGFLPVADCGSTATVGAGFQTNGKEIGT